MKDKKDCRVAKRANVFLTASLEVGGQPRAVRIRNVSPHGAMIDGTVPPLVESKVRLVRGQLTASGTVAWTNSSHFGIAFDSPINVSAWVKRTSHAGQQRVDEVFAALRLSVVPKESACTVLPENLSALIQELAALCGRVAELPDMRIELGEELVKLDTIVQRLRLLDH